MKGKKQQRVSRHVRVRKKISGSDKKPRLTVFRSNKYIYVQLIDDNIGKTIASATDAKKTKAKDSANKIERAKEVGKNIAGMAVKKNIKEIVFDRAGYKYHGRIKAIADGAREGGLNF